MVLPNNALQFLKHISGHARAMLMVKVLTYRLNVLN